jgi:hypothetical protein
LNGAADVVAQLALRFPAVSVFGVWSERGAMMVHPWDRPAYGGPVVTLAEQFYLLAEDPSTGRAVIESTHLGLGLSGALLLDLALRERVALVDSCVVVTSNTLTGEPLLDAALTSLARGARGHGPDHWVRHLARGAHLVVSIQP